MIIVETAVKGFKKFKDASSLDTYSYPDMWEDLNLEHPLLADKIDYKLFQNIIFKYNERVMDSIVNDGAEYYLPFKMGLMKIIKKENKSYTDKDGNVLMKLHSGITKSNLRKQKEAGLEPDFETAKAYFKPFTYYYTFYLRKPFRVFEENGKKRILLYIKNYFYYNFFVAETADKKRRNLTMNHSDKCEILYQFKSKK